MTVPLRREDDQLAALARRAGEGQAAAFEELARRVRGRVRRWASAWTRDEDEAEDVAQQVLITLHLRVGDFDARSRFTTWLYTVTRNLALNRRRTAERRRMLLAREGLAATSTEGAGPDEAAVRLAELVDFYLTRLTPRQREVFALAETHGLNSTQIADRLGITPSTARGLLLKARRTIRLRILESHADLLQEYRS